jgi:hypothetical protein
MNEQLGKADAIANSFEAFIRVHPMSTAILLALVLGWVAASFIKPFLKGVSWKPHALRLMDFVVATTTAYRLWPEAHPVIWALLVGFGSPTVYWLLTSALIWKWPALQKYLSLRELLPETDADPVPPQN